jgi:exopolysaccharide biosynthesis predicted pyruvyltransferase EpsI
MQGHSVSYAASFGDSHFDAGSYEILNSRLQNFKALGIRENQMIPYVSEHTHIPVQRTIDPTLLLRAEEYESITAPQQYKEPYLLLYTRRYNKNMEDYARRIAKERGLKVVEISLRATNKDFGHEMRYDAGVEEFLSLVKGAEIVITNSFHGLIFTVQFRRPFIVFMREQASLKIQELLDLFGINDRLFVTGAEPEPQVIDYDAVHHRIDIARESSFSFLKKELTEYI